MDWLVREMLGDVGSFFFVVTRLWLTDGMRAGPTGVPQDKKGSHAGKLGRVFEHAHPERCRPRTKAGAPQEASKGAVIGSRFPIPDEPTLAVLAGPPAGHPSWAFHHPSWTTVFDSIAD